MANSGTGPVLGALIPGIVLLAAVAPLAGPAGGAEAGSDPQSVTAERMTGPFESIEKGCAGCRDEKRIERPAAPWLEVRIVATGDPKARPEPHNQRRHYLAVRLPSGWWLRELGFSGVICGGDSQSHVSLWAKRLEARDVLPGAGAEIQLETDEGVMGGGGQIDDRRLHLCALGPSGAPSCLALFVYRFNGSARDSWDLPVSFGRDGTVIMTGWAGGATDVKRVYTVTFP